MKNKMTFEFLETIWSGIKCYLSSKRIVCELDFTKSQFICQEGIGKVTRSLLLSLLFFLCFSTAFAQLNLPNEKRCTSKDLELVGARLFDQGECIECETGDGVTRTLILSIKNSTGSNRTSFAFWGILDKIDSDGTINSFPITGCNSKAVPPNTSAVPPNTTTDLEFNDISYICGQRLVIRNLYLAWTSAADNASCPLDPSKIAPKCGTLPSIEINAGVNGTVTSENATCTAGGSIKVAPFGGTPPYKVSLDGGTIFNVAAGGSKTFTGLAANSSHNVTITDSTLPTACSVTKNETVGGPTALPKPEATVTQQPTCTIAKGTVTVTSFTVGDGITYRLKQGIDIKYTAVSGVFSSVDPGTYDFSATIGECTTAGDPITVNARPGTPDAPQLKITQPTASLCSATTTGSIEVCNPIVGATYTLVGGASIVASGSPVIFGNLAANSNPSVTVTNTAGCTSSPTLCSNAVTTCSSPPAGKIAAPTSTKEVIKNDAKKVGFTVSPVPFKDQLTVRYNFDYASQVLVEVFNSQGNKILSKKDYTSSKEIQLSLNRTGQNEVYFVKVTTDKGSSVQKVISSR